MDLRISSFGRRFGHPDSPDTFVLDVPQLTIKFGEITFLMGHNGSGKSVFLTLLAGGLEPTEGQVLLRTHAESWVPREYPVAMVRQRAEDSLALELSLRENLLLRLQPTGLMGRLWPRKQLQQKVHEIVRNYPELAKKVEQSCHELSVGQRQTLAFLAVTSQNRPLLLLDEFLSATDQSTSTHLRQLTRDYAKSKPACVFVVSHDIGLALADADRIFILQDGQFVKDIKRGSPDWNETTLVHWLAYPQNGELQR